MQQENNEKIKTVVNKANTIIVHSVFPFHIIPATSGNLFDPVNDSFYHSIDSIDINAIRNSIIDLQSNSNLNSIGDFSKYYDFISLHFGKADSIANLELYVIEPDALLPKNDQEGLKNLGAQIAETEYYLGNSEDIRLDKIEKCMILLNPVGKLGYVIFECTMSSNEGTDMLELLSKSEYFRNIGWRQGQTVPKKTSNQYKKHALSFKNENERSFELTMYDIFNNYFHPFQDHIRFYQNRLTTLFTSVCFESGNISDKILRDMFFDMLRVPDMNVSKFDHENSEPTIRKIGRNVICAALNEGAVVIESINDLHVKKSIARKYLPAFILAINQREILLKTMQRISHLNAEKLLNMDEMQLQTITQLKANLLVLQLKQIFYSVSNTHEVELFFNQLQTVFNIEVMMKENDQSIKEIYNLLEAKRAVVLEKYREYAEIREKEEAEKEEFRSRIVNMILGAIGCLGLFSFFKDVWPFFQDSQYASLYKFISIALPFVIMGWLIWYMFGRKSK
jgi:hypothetical protein